MAEVIKIPQYEQISDMMTQLLTYYTDLARTYNDMFYNPIQMDIQVPVFDENGQISEKTVPNRAKDMRFIQHGDGEPEGHFSATIGTTYQDTTNGNLYIKRYGQGNTGWFLVSADQSVKEGYSNPEGQVTGAKGDLYKDITNCALYIKTTETGNTGWITISANTATLADRDLSNLTNAGESHFDIRYTKVDLSNLSNAGRTYLNTNYSNVSLSNLNDSGESHFDSRYSKVDLSNLSSTGESHFDVRYSKVDLSNLSAIGNNHLHALKGYLDNGELLTDKEGFLDVNSYATSDFDVNKFTKVGTPIISNDGVMSNISASNYAKIDTSNIVYSKSLEIIFPIRRTSLNTIQWFASSGFTVSSTGGIWLGFSATNQLRFFASSGDGSYDIADNRTSGTIYLNELIKYYVKLQFTGTQYIISYSTDKINWTEAIVVDSSTIAPINNANLFLGYGQDAAYFQGDYFLNEVLIKADGKPVFSGNKTGIDIVKPIDYTPVGSPTITDDGIATFAVNKYITLPDIDVTGKTFEIDFGKFKPNNVTVTQDIISGISSDLLTVGIAGSNSRIFARSSNWTVGINTVPLTANNDYYLKAGYDGTDAYLALSTDGINYTKTTVTPNTPFTTLALRIGTQYNGTVPILFPYDLNQFKIYVDNKLVYQPCLLIPYAKSSTGSKIVDSYYRDRVIDVYNQYGIANYYTLSGTDFTLPMGEIYGMIRKLQQLLENEIGLPVPTLSNTLYDNEIWLEGAEVSKTTYAKLYSIYGDTYGTPDDDNNFVLPNFKNRVIQGIGSDTVFGYIEAGLPNHTHSLTLNGQGGNDVSTGLGACWGGDTSYAGTHTATTTGASNAIYGGSDTVQPPAIKVRFKTRYE